MVYINSPAGFYWVTRDFVETLHWNRKGAARPIKLPDLLFSVHPVVLKRMVDISNFLKEGNTVAVDDIFIKAGLKEVWTIFYYKKQSYFPKYYNNNYNALLNLFCCLHPNHPVKPWVPSQQNCQHSDVHYNFVARSSQSWSRRPKFCDQTQMSTCPVCGNKFRSDN